jgi:succinoglycan biosynthesis protein ExoA
MPLAETYNSDARPTVSVILAVRNEAAHIESAIRSLLQQASDSFDLEILAIDGLSTDGTVEVIRDMAAHDARVRLVVNDKCSTPHAFNLGLQHARGEYVCIFGSHARYDTNYISACLEELEKHGAAGVSGYLVTAPSCETLQAQLVAWALAHPFGSSGSSVRTQKDGFVETIPFPVFRRSVLLEVGGYDEQLDRNQDNDMNQKLRARGHCLYLTCRTKAEYFTRSSITSMAKHAFRSGYWNLLSWRKNPASMSVRHFVPFAFVSAVMMTAMLTWWSSLLLLTVVGAHAVAGLLAATQLAIRERTLRSLLLPVVFFTFHFSYGLGTLWAVLLNDRLDIAEPATAT